MDEGAGPARGVGDLVDSQVADPLAAGVQVDAVGDRVRGFMAGLHIAVPQRPRWWSANF